MKKKTFILPTMEVVRIQKANIIATSCQGQACMTEEACDDELEAKESTFEF